MPWPFYTYEELSSPNKVAPFASTVAFDMSGAAL